MTLCTDRNISWPIDWDELYPIGEGAEQSCHGMANNPDVVVKMPHLHRNVEDLIEGTIKAEDEGVGPRWHAFVVNEEDTIIGVIVDKCLTYEDIKVELEGWTQGILEDLGPYDDRRETMHDILYHLDEDPQHALFLLEEEGCKLPEVIDLDNLLSAVDNYSALGYDDMHYGNVGRDERGDWVIIDTASYFMGTAELE